MFWSCACLGKSADWVLKSLSGLSFCCSKPFSMLEINSYWHLFSISDLLYFVSSHTLFSLQCRKPCIKHITEKHWLMAPFFIQDYIFMRLEISNSGLFNSNGLFLAPSSLFPFFNPPVCQKVTLEGIWKLFDFNIFEGVRLGLSPTIAIVNLASYHVLRFVILLKRFFPFC